MVVKIRFGRGPVVTRRKGKNGGIAMLSASMLTMVSICFASLGFWRLAEDVDLTGGFVYTEGLRSHWQVWLFAAGTTQYGAWRLTRYARLARKSLAPEAATQEVSTSARATAEV
jgi:hypothetical protein